MKRFLPLLCLVLAGCASASADPLRPFARNLASAHQMKAAPQKRVLVEEDDEPLPPDPAPNPGPVEPELTLPPKVEGDVGTFIKIKAATNGQHVRWKALDRGLAVFPAEMLIDSKATVVTATVPGEYRLLAYTALNDIPSDPVECMVVVHGAQPPPVPPVPPVPPGPTPPPVPPPPVVVTSSQLWIVVLDDWRQRTPEVTQILNDPALRAQLEAEGHSWRSVDASQAADVSRFKTQLDANGGMPCVVLMAKGGANDSKWLNKEPADMKLPLTPDGFRALIRKYSGK